MNSNASASERSPLLWGAYLACSWTWCIGMFLPTILLREMGWSGYLIFALPNAFGAAAMGWLFKTRSSSGRFVENHASAIWWFSAVTLAFHVYWIIWISGFLPMALGVPVGYLAGCLGLACIFALVCIRMIRREKMQKAALALFVFSLIVLFGAFLSTDLNEANALLLDAVPQNSGALFMLPVMVFGFFFCPYLDVTFHHARQQLDTSTGGRLGFSIGFLLLFPFMIFLTTRYAGLFVDAMNGSTTGLQKSPWLAIGILLHLAFQWIFTVSVHFERMQTLKRADSRKTLLFMLIILAAIAGLFVSGIPAYKGLNAGEIGYRLFMSAYGLIFPTYILYRVIASVKNKEVRPLSLWLAIALVAPFFWMGFIERESVWLLPGLLPILVGFFISRKKQAG